MKLNKFLIHIPHSSINLPDIFYERLLVNKEYIEKENIFMSDYLIDAFITSKFNNVVKFNYSRLFCDVERYKDDSNELMSKYGMGVVYTNDSNNRKIINIDNLYKNYIIKNYYDKHHKKLDDLVIKILEKYNECFIIDLHSYSDSFVGKVLNKFNNPDICIGIDNSFYSKELTELTIKHFKDYGYSVDINYPYSGTIVPNVIYKNKDKRVKSIMIEINKRIYLDNKENYDKLMKCMNNYYDKLEGGLYE